MKNRKRQRRKPGEKTGMSGHGHGNGNKEKND
jgi:hypothetical protein